MRGMNPPRPGRKVARSYQRHGLNALNSALETVANREDWIRSLGPVGEALRQWRGELIEAVGGESVASPQERALIELATRTHLMLESVDRFILGMPALHNLLELPGFALGSPKVRHRGVKSALHECPERCRARLRADYLLHIGGPGVQR